MTVTLEQLKESLSSVPQNLGWDIDSAKDEEMVTFV